MTWLILTLVAALAMTLQDVFTKKIADSTGTLLVAWLRWCACIPFLLVCIPFITIPHLSLEFYVVTGVLIPLEALALILYMKAIRSSPLNVTLPFLSLTPILMIVTGYLFLGETLRPAQIVGVFLIAAGGYLINIHTVRQGILQPIVSISREKGSLMMIAVAAIYSVTAALGKVAVLLSEPIFFGVFYVTVISVVLMPVVFSLGPSPRLSAGRFRRNLGFVALLGFVGAVNAVAHFSAIRLVEAASMMAVKRTSLLFGIVFGRLFFDEPHFLARLVGGVLMTAGVALIYLT
jgi:drug/metabolite transporter (DMT)-like permease